MTVRMFLPLILLFLSACAPVIKPRAVSPTGTAPATVTPTGTPSVTPSPTPHIAQVTAYEALRVRAEPMGLRIGYLRHGDSVTLTGACRTGWAEIEWDGGTAWVNADYLSDNKCQE